MERTAGAWLEKRTQGRISVCPGREAKASPIAGDSQWLKAFRLRTEWSSAFGQTLWCGIPGLDETGAAGSMDPATGGRAQGIQREKAKGTEPTRIKADKKIFRMVLGEAIMEDLPSFSDSILGGGFFSWDLDAGATRGVSPVWNASRPFKQGRAAEAGAKGDRFLMKS